MNTRWLKKAVWQGGVVAVSIFALIAGWLWLLIKLDSHSTRLYLKALGLMLLGVLGLLGLLGGCLYAIWKLFDENDVVLLSSLVFLVVVGTAVAFSFPMYDALKDREDG